MSEETSDITQLRSISEIYSPLLSPEQFQEAMGLLISGHFVLSSTDVENAARLLVLLYGFVDRPFKDIISKGQPDEIAALKNRFDAAFQNEADVAEALATCTHVISQVYSGGHYTLRMNYTSMSGRGSFVENPDIMREPAPGVSSRNLPAYPFLCDASTASYMGIVKLLESWVTPDVFLIDVVLRYPDKVELLFPGDTYAEFRDALYDLKVRLETPVKALSYQVTQVLFPIDDTGQEYHALTPVVSSRVLAAMTEARNARYNKDAQIRYDIRSVQCGGSKPQNGGSICNRFRGIQPHFISRKPVVRSLAASPENYLNGRISLNPVINSDIKASIRKLARLETCINTHSSNNIHDLENEAMDIGHELIRDILSPFFSAYHLLKRDMQEGEELHRLKDDVRSLMLSLMQNEPQAYTHIETIFLDTLRKHGCRFGQCNLLTLFQTRIIKPFLKEVSL